MVRIRVAVLLGVLCFCLNAAAVAAEGNPAPLAVASREVKLVYPEFRDFGPASLKMTQTVAAEINAFAANLLQPEYSGQAGYTVVYSRSPLVSITVDELSYRYHAAHPMSYLRAFTFDTRTGETLQLADLFRPDADYRGRLGQIMTAQIAEQGIRLLDGKAFAGIKDDQEFYLTPGALVVYYQLYEYTPYAAGFLKFSVPCQAIADLLRPEVAAALTAGQ